jgi:hypothetical protein
VAQPLFPMTQPMSCVLSPAGQPMMGKIAVSPMGQPMFPAGQPMMGKCGCNLGSL